ncbi:glycosyltransferase [Massilibacteroides sp.]|uniref:glycosyltransferase n=1 Tax=Massilibacteroides sp. TaxID=2034766 RepID=UPI002633337C|nr:glycosyltransferase [Massilibacteroides sp.]MDD4516520.1 glycosyltransferase [Massilibacteroides sp.]
MKKKKLLIICDLFPPAFGPRMGYLVKYMSSFGWDVEVITEKVKEDMFAFIADKNKIHYIDYYKNQRFRKVRWLFIVLADLLFNYKNRKIADLAIEQIRMNHFDLILCSTYRSFPLPAALITAKKTGLPLVSDIRDIIEQYPKNEFFTSYIPPIPLLKDLFISFFKKQNIKERNKVLKASDHVTTVSSWHKQLLEQQNKQISLIYNGFDPELFYPNPVVNSQFTITYTGRLHSFGMQDPTLLFSAIKYLSEKKVITPQLCRLEWYVDERSAELLKKESDMYEINEYMDIKDYVPANKIPEVLNKSSILLLLTNISRPGGPRGIMGTKTFEYMAVHKPILCIRSDEDCLEETIKETNAGIAARTEQEVIDFIKYHLDEWKKTGLTKSEIKKEKLVLYSRKEQALQFIRIFEQVLEKHNG